MPRIDIHAPGEPVRSLEVGPAGAIVGRAEDAEAFVTEPRASRRHARVLPLEEGGWIVEDLASANGTWVGEQRILRRRLADGDSVRIGATRIDLGGRAEALVASTLLTVRSVGDKPAPAPLEEPPPEEPRPRRERPAPPPAGLDASALVKGGVLIALAAVLGWGADSWFGGPARRLAERASLRQEALDVLAERASGDAFAEKADAFVARHEGTPEASLLARHAAAARSAVERHDASERRLGAVLGRLGPDALADARIDLLRLRTEVAADKVLADRVADALLVADRTQEEAEAAHLAAVASGVEAALAARRYGRAEALVSALGERRTGFSPVAVARWGRLKEQVEAASRARYDEARAAVGQAPPEARLDLLIEATRDLAGTSLERLIAEQVRSTLRSGPTEAPTPSGPTPAAPTAGPDRPPTARPPGGTIPADALARLGGAREDMSQRRWGSARAAFASLADGAAGPDLAVDARAHVEDLDRILALAETLSSRAAGNPPTFKISLGRITVVAADGDTVTWRAGDGEPAPHLWGALTADDVLTLLEPTPLTFESRLGVAVLAAALDRRADAVEALAPVYTGELGDRALADRVVARHLYGLAAPPEGGYRLHAGDLLDGPAYERAVEQERLASLGSELDELLADLAKDGVYRKLQKVREVRVRLDEARKYALLAIFNETHYPYPYNKGSKPYQAVQGEVARRVAAVEALWNDATKARIQRTGALAKRLDRLEEVLAALRAGQALTPEREAAAWPYLAYAGPETWTVQNLYLDDAERERLAYDAWVRDVYNPARTETAAPVEREQVAITNDYRRMIGFTAAVQPGPGAYDEITDATAKDVLDGGKVLRMAPIRAVRVDNRLVLAARAHSEDMMRRGYFSHFAPPNPETGAGTTTPQERMNANGYQGWAMSENIAMNDSPLNAHKAWCTSSGHHRNILSPWEDLGVGYMARRWTQNFGGGGGAPPKVAPTTDVGTPGGRTPPTTGR
ncbi:MAG: FHA domain-containing protein [Planctomycetota bacterium]